MGDRQLVGTQPTLPLDSRLRGNDPPEADRGLGGATDSEIPLESPFAKVGVGDRVQGEVLPGV